MLGGGTVFARVTRYVTRFCANSSIAKSTLGTNERLMMDFGVPIDALLRLPLKDWAEALLEERRLKCEGYFNPKPIRTNWIEHPSGKRNWQYLMWDVLMFQAWLEKNSI